MYFIFRPIAAKDTWPWEFPTGSSSPWWNGLMSGVDTESTPGFAISGEIKSQELSILANEDFFNPPVPEGNGGIGIIVCSPPGRYGDGVTVNSILAAQASGSASVVGGIPLIMAGGINFEQAAGPEKLGKKFYGPRSRIDVFGLLDTDDHSYAGIRGRANGIYGNLYFEVGDTVIKDFDEDWNNKVSEAFAIWRQGNTDVTFGRQHYLEGPANNNPLGSLFSFFTFDGIRIHHQASRLSADLAWIDSFKDRIVESDEGAGWLGRLRTPVGGGHVGVTVFNEHGAGTGHSLDLSYPLLPGDLDLYAELGDDPLGRHLETWGLYFPKLYQTAGLDIFVEYAKRRNYDSVLSIMAYQEIKNDWTAVFTAKKASGEDFEVGIGAIKRFGTLID
jgi:hypothetical protein